jgi:hypothetical protein
VNPLPRAPSLAAAHLGLVRPFASRMKHARMITMLAILVTADTTQGEGSQPRPIAASILRVQSQSVADWRAVGNVSVTLSDGHREVWTTTGHCLLPKVSSSGLVGWTHAVGQHSRGGWMNTQLRIARDGRLIAHFDVSRAFIDFWDFTDKDTCVVIRCVNAHGPSWIEKYRIDTGDLIAEGSCSHDVPEWAKPYATQPGA